MRWDAKKADQKAKEFRQGRIPQDDEEPPDGEIWEETVTETGGVGRRFLK